MRRLFIHHITFNWAFNRFTVGIKFYESCTTLNLGFLDITFWHEHNIILKYPHKVSNPRTEAINSIIKEADEKISSLFDDNFSEFGGWKVDYIDQIDENSVHINMKCYITIRKPVTEILIQDSVNQAEVEYQNNLRVWNSLPWYVKLFPQLNKEIYRN